MFYQKIWILEYVKIFYYFTEFHKKNLGVVRLMDTVMMG